MEVIDVRVVGPGQGWKVMDADMVYRWIGMGARTVVVRKTGQILGLTNIV